MKPSMNEPLLSIYVGQKLTIVAPGQKTLTIREQNGADDDILSSVKDAVKGLSLVNYIAAITVNDESLKRAPTAAEVLNWRVNTFYYTLLMSRIHSLGNTMDFTLECSNPSCRQKNSFTQDLTEYTVETWDKDILTPEFYAKPENKYLIFDYPEGTQGDVLHTLKTGKRIKFSQLTVAAENSLIQIPQDQLNRNKQFIVRNFCIIADDNTAIPVGSFNIFSSREMAEIRKVVDDNDKLWEPLMECTCENCQHKEIISIIHRPDFFYPQAS